MTSANTSTLSPEQGLFELTLLNAERQEYEFEDVVIEGVRKGIPLEVITRLQEIWDVTKDIAGEGIAIGKIIVIAIFDFLKANPTLTAGMAIGAAVSSLIFAVPLIGPLLAPLGVALSTAYGAGVGAAMQEGDYSASPVTAAVALAERFLEMLRQILIAISQYWS
jgi:hypothetical protein